MAKIAVEFEPIAGFADGHGARRPESRLLAHGDGWSVSDVICSAGPHDRPFEERHLHVCIAIVAAGSFQYRSSAGREMLTPGSLFLGNAGEYFECGHEHGIGDRCISFSYQPQYFEDLAAETGMRRMCFSTLRVPPVRELSLVVTQALVGLAESYGTAHDGEQSTFDGEDEEQAQIPLERKIGSNANKAKWEETGIELAARALDFASAGKPNQGMSPAAEARVTRIVRKIESHPDWEHGLGALAREAKLSRYHFLRIFRQLSGLTPHQYVLRTRLRWAATRLMLEPVRVLDIALDSGFGDVSNFNHAFLAEFGVSPRSYRGKLRPNTRKK